VARRPSAAALLLPLAGGSGSFSGDMPVDDILLEAEDKMIKTEQVVQHEFSGVRTGKASPALVENIMVEAYDSHMRLRELAGITTPEHRMLVIQPWDASTVHAIEKAIQKANLGLNPTIQGKILRIVLPELSEERRHEFVKIIHKMTENGRVAIRHVRRDALEQMKKESKEGGITEDELEHGEKEVQKLTDQYVAKLEAHLAHKEKEIMTV
jgi:ribosome recycling factor